MSLGPAITPQVTLHLKKVVLKLVSSVDGESLSRPLCAEGEEEEPWDLQL